MIHRNSQVILLRALSSTFAIFKVVDGKKLLVKKQTPADASW
jgi:hypothetical protein